IASTATLLLLTPAAAEPTASWRPRGEPALSDSPSGQPRPASSNSPSGQPRPASSDSPRAGLAAAASSDAAGVRLDAGYRGSPPSFDPAHTLRRRDAAFLVARLAGLDTTPPPSSAFRDVPPSDLQFGAIEALWRERVASGCRAAHGVRG